MALQRWGETRVTQDVDVSLLTGFGDEQTAVRFTLKGQDVINVNTTPKSLVELTRSSGSKEGGGGAATGPTGPIDVTTGQAIQQ